MSATTGTPTAATSAGWARGGTTRPASAQGYEAGYRRAYAAARPGWRDRGRDRWNDDRGRDRDAPRRPRPLGRPSLGSRRPRVRRAPLRGPRCRRWAAAHDRSGRLGYDGRVKSHHYWKAVEAFKTRLRDAVPHDELKALHARTRAEAPRLRRAAVRDHRRLQLRPVAPRRARCCGSRSPILQGFTFFNMTTLLHEVVHNSVFDKRRRGLEPGARAPLRVDERHLGQPVHALAPRPPRQPRLLGGRPQAPLALAEAQRPLVQAALLHARAHPHLLPGGGERGALVPDGAAAHDRPRARRRPCVLQLGVAAALVHFGGWGALLRVWAVPYFLVFPVAFTLEPPRPALRHRPHAPAQVVHGHGAEPAVGLPVRLLELPRRAPLLPERALLQPPEAAPAPAAPLRASSGSSPTPTARSCGSGS